MVRDFLFYYSSDNGYHLIDGPFPINDDGDQKTSLKLAPGVVTNNFPRGY